LFFGFFVNHLGKTNKVIPWGLNRTPFEVWERENPAEVAIYHQYARHIACFNDIIAKWPNRSKRSYCGIAPDMGASEAEE
jgi:hypothetical protein